ncbi:hypothetical protein ACMFMG_009119 [Clarireedia jacksonii]
MFSLLQTPANLGFMMSPGSSPPRGQSPDRNRSSALVHPQSRRSPSRDNGPYCKRITKTNPLMHGQSDGRETRRKLFLRRVREDSEEKRWKARGGDDEMMRTIWIAEQRRRAEKKARDAAGWAVDAEDHEEVDMDLGAFEASLNLDEVMAEEVARNEQEELEAILSSMTEAERRQTLDAAYESVLILDEEIGPIDEREATAWARGNLQPSLSQHDMMVMDVQRQMNASSPDTNYGDDGDYDAIFLDVMQDESRILGSSFQPITIQTDQEMMDTDMS